jgi:hypothetical protein
MESSMQRSSEHGAWSKTGRALGIAAAVLCATALSQPNLAYAGPHGGGGGGFHGGGGGGFHGGGFHGFHGGGVGAFRGGFASLHNGFGDRREGFHEHHDRDGRFFFGGVWPYGWDYYPDYGYYDYTQPYSSQTWYYCSDPSGYYPYVTQCNTGWQAVPAS